MERDKERVKEEREIFERKRERADFISAVTV